MKYGIVAFPSKQTQDLANRYRKRYDTHYALIPPHITLVEMFDGDENTLQQTSEILEQLATQFGPVAINASRVSTFSPATNTIYFRIEPTAQLNALHDSICSALQVKQQHSFTPHITIAQDLSDSEHDDIIGQLKMVGVDVEETIDRLHLVYQLENGTWTPHETFVLIGAE